MILFHHIIQILHLPDDDVGPMLLVIALDSGFIGFTAINRDRLGDPVTAARVRQKAQRRRCIPVLREQKSMVWPCLSTARYKYRHSPFTLI
jgi:hypothetical protein